MVGKPRRSMWASMSEAIRAISLSVIALPRPDSNAIETTDVGVMGVTCEIRYITSNDSFCNSSRPSDSGSTSDVTEIGSANRM